MQSEITISSLFFIQPESLEEAPIAHELLHEEIIKKTKRGRKSKTELPKEKRCEICLEFLRYSNLPLISCNVCEAEFHLTCYKHPLINQTEFTCERCIQALEDKKPIESYKCLVCARCDGVLYKATKTGEFYHQICSRFVNELCEKSNEENMSRNAICKWRYKNSCRYCREKLCKSKAVIKCGNSNCKSYYHIPCAIQKGIIFSTKYQTQFYGIEDEVTPIPFNCCGHNKKLAASYRRDVIYQRNETISTTRTVITREGNITTESDDEYNSNNTITDDVDECSFPFNNTLNINFDAMIESSKEEDINEDTFIDFNNVSPKDRTIFAFKFLEMESENYDL